MLSTAILNDALINHEFVAEFYFSYFSLKIKNKVQCFFKRGQFLFVCVEVLWSSQPNGVMSSAVSLPNHTFTRQA